MTNKKKKKQSERQTDRRSHLDGALRLDEPAPQHGLHLAVGELVVGGVDLALHRVLQQEAPQTPVEELPRRGPLQDVLRRGELD